MNMLLTFKLVGSVLLIESALMLIPLAVSLFTGGTDAGAFTAALAVSMGVGGLLSLLRPKNDNLRAREGFAIVAPELDTGVLFRVAALLFPWQYPLLGGLLF